jgi:hypothetical protein
MTDLSRLRVYSPGFQAIEWGFGYDQIVDLATALQQPCKIAVMPVYCDRVTEFSYQPEFASVRLDQFDLVLFTDIEWRSQTELISWIKTTGVTNWLLHVAGRWLDEDLDPRTVYRPAWSFNFLRWNPARADFPTERPWSFDCLLGARRIHRDFVMLNLQQSQLLDCSITTYRDIFQGHWINTTPPQIQSLFRGVDLQYPYVSDNLDPSWEVKPQMDNSVSGLVPWEIYNRTWFSVVCETLSSGRVFLSAEKIAKCLQARRLFVVFAIQNFLQHYRDWGFETFGDVIDESYDTQAKDIVRWSKAFEQVKYLCSENLPVLLHKLRPRLDHNHHRLYQLQQIKRQEMHELVSAYLK